LRVFRDYDGAEEGSERMTTPGKIEADTPVKRKFEETITSTVVFPLTPPATVKSEATSFDLRVEKDEMTTRVTEHFVRRSKRQKPGSSTDDPFG
jgi:hypothetical protein